MMFGLSKVISTDWDDVKRLIVKVLFRGKIIDGKGDLSTPKEISSYGIDSNPIKGKRAGFAKTGVNGKYYILGYLNTDRKAEPGEARMFSTNDDGGFKFNVWVKKDGTVLIGESDVPEDYTNFLVNFNELKVEFNKLKTDHNNLVNAFNAHVHLDPVSGSTAAPTAVPSLIPASSNTSNIDNTKNDKIKTL